MNQPTLLGKLFSPAGFGLVLLLFFLPFVAVSCGPEAHRVTATFSGLDMVTGGAPVYSGPDIKPDDQLTVDELFADQYDNEPLAIVAAAVVLGAMATAFIRDRRIRHTAGVALAGLAAGLVLAAEIRSVGRLNHIQLHNADGQVTDISPVYARPMIGFYLAMGVLLVLVVGHAIALFRPPAPVVAGTGPPGHDDQTGYTVPLEYAQSSEHPDGPDEQWAAPPIWAAPDEEPTVQDQDAEPGGAYDEWLDAAWPSSTGQPPTTPHQTRQPPGQGE